MSAQTTQDLNDALRAHVEDEHPGAILTDWVTYLVAVQPSDGFVLDYVASPGSMPHNLFGLTSVVMDKVVDDFMGPQEGTND